MLKGFTREEKGWIMYDWANSAFSAIISAIILPVYFKNIAGADNAYWWGYATSIATFICAVGAPVMGTLGDYRGFKMRLFTVFVFIGAGATALLAAVESWQALMVFYIVGTVGFNGSCVFYDGFLKDVTTNERMDRVSSYGYGLGYIGGSTIPLVISMALIQFGGAFGLETMAATKFSFLLTAAWWIAFTIPMWRNVKQVHFVEQEGSLARQSFSRMGAVAREIFRCKPLLLFVLAYFFYIDGVGTIIHMATIFGSSMGMQDMHMMLILMVVQLVAFPCAIVYGNKAKKYGARAMILFGIGTYFVVCLVALGLEPLSRLHTGAGTNVPLLLGFVLLGALVGTAQGGIQALSRSFFGKIIPEDSANEFFGFFDIFGKFSAVMGPALFSLVWASTQKVYLGIVPVLLMFLIGGALFLRVPADIKSIREKA